MIRFYGEELLTLRPTQKLEDYPMPAIRDCLFNMLFFTWLWAMELYFGETHGIAP